MWDMLGPGGSRQIDAVEAKCYLERYFKGYFKPERIPNTGTPNASVEKSSQYEASIEVPKSNSGRNIGNSCSLEPHRYCSC